jgi:hypothetical protein
VCALAGLALGGCKAAQSPAPAQPPTGPPQAAGQALPVNESPAPGEPRVVPAPEASPSVQPAPAATAPLNPATPTTPAPATPAPSVGERKGPPLPELRVKSFGLHVGGAARDAAARADYLRVLESGWWRYLDCYRLLDRPGVEGTFGADLHVSGDGGKARVAHPRTKLPGTPFRECMERAFASAHFAPSPSGRAVVLSYSVKFTLAL